MSRELDRQRIEEHRSGELDGDFEPIEDGLGQDALHGLLEVWYARYMAPTPEINERVSTKASMRLRKGNRW